MNESADTRTTPDKALDAVSVVIPTYNRAGLVTRAVASALAQCVDGDEVIVVDDGSTDDTQRMLLPFLDRIIYVRVPNGGVGRARNIGLNSARNPLIAFLDSDDEWAPGKLALQRNLMAARSDVVFCFSDVTHQYASGDQKARRVAHFLRTPNLGELLLGAAVSFSSLAALPAGQPDVLVHIGDLYPTCMEYPCVYSQTAMVRREAVGAVRFPEDVSWSEDWEFFARLSRLGSVAFLGVETAIIYVKHGKPQLIYSDFLYQLTTRITVLMRVWGSDSCYLAHEQERYERVLDRYRVLRARQLIRMGFRREARSELELVQHPHPLLSAATRVPSPVTRGFIAARRRLVARFES